MAERLRGPDDPVGLIFTTAIVLSFAILVINAVFSVAKYLWRY